MPRIAIPVLTLAATAALAAGCGGSGGSTTAGTTTAAPTGPKTASYPTDGLTFRSPGGWSVVDGNGPLVATVRAGQATVAVWRYPRSQRLPRTKDELKAARDALIGASRSHDATFQEIKSAATTIAGRPAVQVRADQTIEGQKRTVRSSHIYADGAEIVVDAIAEPGSFREIDAKYFRPILRSLQVTKPQGSG